MKLKKVLAGVLASAMALTTMVMTSFTASAENEVVLWEGSTAMTTGDSDHGWDGNVNIAASVFADVTSSGKLIVTIADVTDGAQYGLRYGDWSGNINDYSDAMTASTTSFEYEVTDELLAAIKSKGLVVAGHHFTATKIAYVANSTGGTTPEPGTSCVIWEGSTDLGTDWSSNVSASDITANENDKLVVSYTIGTAEYQQIKIMDGSWTPITAPVTNDYDCVELAAGTSSYEVILNAADAAALTSGGILISGYNVTVTKIELVSASGGGSNNNKPGETDPEPPKPVVTVVPNVISSVTVPTNSAKKFEITDPVTGKAIPASVNKLAKALSKITNGSELAFDTGNFGMVLRKNVIKEIIDNDLTLTVKTSKATFIIDAENLAKAKTINIPAIMKTANFKKLVKEGNTFNVIVTEKNKVEIELA